MAYNFVADEQFPEKETFLQTFFKQSAIFIQKSAVLRFWTPSGDLGAMYNNHLRLSGKRLVDFLLVLTELFSLGVKAEALGVNIGLKSAILLQWGLVDPKFQIGGVAPIQPFFFAEN